MKQDLRALEDADLVFESERLIFRPFQLCDLDLAIALLTDERVTRYVCDQMTAQQVESHLPTQIRRGAGGRIGIWAVTRKDNGEKIGTSVLLPLPIEEEDTDWSLVTEQSYPDSEIETGYLLVPSAWGNGFATEICKQTVNFAFENTSLKELVAVTDPENHASGAVLQKSGFQPEGQRLAYNCQCAAFRLPRI